mgnify:CR=1 FL=1
MAATVYTGRKQNFTYTNNTGGNVRVIIYWLYVDQTAGADRLTMRWGTQTSGGWPSNASYKNWAESYDWGGSKDFHMGKNIMSSNGPHDHVSSNAKSDSSGAFAYPSEIYLANGHVFEILCTGSTSNVQERMIGYNIVVIPE